MSLQSAQQFVFGFWDNKPIEFEQVEENLSSDGGLIAFYQIDQKLGWTKSLANLISDPRSDPTHTALSIVRQRIFGIIAGYQHIEKEQTIRKIQLSKTIRRKPYQGTQM
ncbi:hypothetical protein Q31b_45140 [Novipirellula aureliae]|uniref:Transposase DDE domain-containing protein n=1 Tax=Novipirellula aureliae TaxID=2527966 RepID=A0A5C6DNG2_9BACT|nr:transposase [Novipirellula aureliae]TWU37725.1 hypothetical protein Q31b_45140 [Novipirellula aureliae]